MEHEPPSQWDLLSDEVRWALAATWRQGVPPNATALYARWWQFETWLREVVYVELRARDGVNWAGALPPLAEDRETKDRQQRHMRTPDAEARLAYLDTGPLFDLFEANWSLFEHALLDDRAIWLGRVVELRKIRNRIGHCRRPHPDDLGRLEQTLRDLDRAAFETVASYNRQYDPDAELSDPLVASWIRESHPDAQRLVGHADRNKDVAFALRYSRRPWAPLRDADDPISGSPGYLWHAAWYLGRSSLQPRKFWEDSQLDAHRDLIVYAGFTGMTAVEVSFAAVDDPETIADAVGDCFDAVLMNHSFHGRRHDEDWDRWIAANSDLDVRLQVASAWTIVDDSTTPITMFGA